MIMLLMCLARATAPVAVFLLLPPPPLTDVVVVILGEMLSFDIDDIATVEDI